MTTREPVGRVAMVVTAAACGIAVLAVLGWAVARGHGIALISLVLGVAALWLAVEQRGALIGLLLLGAASGLPFVNASSVVTARLRVQDLAIVALIVLSAAWAFSDAGRYRPGRTAVQLGRAGALLLAWWIWTLGRSSISGHASVVQAAGYARDFLYFSILLMVLPRVRLRGRDIQTLIAVLAVGTSAFAVGQILTSVGAGSLPWLVHAQTTRQLLGLTRVYAFMVDLLIAGFALSAAAALLADRGSRRATATAVGLLFATGLVVELGRAYWLGLGAGFVVVAGWAVIRGDGDVSRILNRRLAVLAGALSLGVLLTVLLASSNVAHTGIIHRMLSGLSDLQSSTGTVGAREALINAMTGYLGPHWPIGLGFLPPSQHYYFGLPTGSIRQSDVGVLSAVVTMGVIGAALIYAPLLIVLRRCLRRPKSPNDATHAWLRYGGAIWIVGTVVSSITLITLFSAGGLTLTAVMLTLLADAGGAAPGEATAIGDHAEVEHDHLRHSAARRAAPSAVLRA